MLMVINKKLNYKILIFFFFLIFFIKMVVFFLLIKFNIFGGGDANYYHKVVLEYNNYFVNFWPKLLSFLNYYELYNREVIKYILFVLSSLFIPFLVAYNVARKDKKIINIEIFWIVSIFTSLYPMLFLFSLDIYRDIVMVFLFVVAVTFIHISIEEKINFRLKVFNLLIYILISYHLYFWRPYLGASLLLVLFIYPIIKKVFLSFKTLIILYFFILTLFFLLGFFDPILSYRGINGFEMGNSSIGIGLIGKNIIEFNLLFIYSSLLQIFSLHFVNIGAFALFFLESLPFTIGLFYIIKNRIYLTDFHKFLLLFFIVYGTIWLLGNDNLGTAMRLRIFNYICILIIATSIYFSRKKIVRRKT